jgi:hypothetical protein
MKKFIILSAIALLLVAGCTPATKVTASWKSPKAGEKSYKSVFVAALMGNTIAKSTLENDIATVLNNHQISTVKSMDEFPPTFANDSVAKEDMMGVVRKQGSDAILTISVLKKETESRYVSGGYAPLNRYGWYGNFWGYYNYWHPYAFNESYYTRDEIYYLETNLYDTNSEVLLWSAQSQTYTFNGLANFSKEFAKGIVEKMKTDGILK